MSETNDGIRELKATVEISFWRCSSPECGTRHKSESAALRCQHHRSWQTREQRVEKKDPGRAAAIMILKARGHSYSEISRAFGLSPARIRQIHTRIRTSTDTWCKKFNDG